METGGRSNTAITDQLICIGVTERISVTPSVLTKKGNASSSEKERGRKENSSSLLSHSLKKFVVFFPIFIHK